MHINTKVVLAASGIMLGIAGIVLTFLPEETQNYLDLGAGRTPTILVQLLGALYFALGMLNWMAKSSLTGGIYNRPVVIANLSHFLIAGLALARGLLSDSPLPATLWTAGIIYILFALLFGLILFRDPITDKDPEF